MLTESSLDPIVKLCGHLDARHFSVFGSATRKPLSEVGDVDLYLVVPRMDRSAYDKLVAAAKMTAETLGTLAKRPWCIELRHGPFKPAPDSRNLLQLHLLIDDETSFECLPYVLRAHRAATEHPVIGKSLQTKAPIWNSRSCLLREARLELTRWRDALTARKIVFRHWVFNPDPHLAEGLVSANTAWDLRCLLRGAATTSDLHYRAAMLTGFGMLSLNENLALPLVKQIEEAQCPWQDFVGCWDRIRDRAVTIINRRIENLRQM